MYFYVIPARTAYVPGTDGVIMLAGCLEFRGKKIARLPCMPVFYGMLCVSATSNSLYYFQKIHNIPYSFESVHISFVYTYNTIMDFTRSCVKLLIDIRIRSRSHTHARARALIFFIFLLFFHYFSGHLVTRKCDYCRIIRQTQNEIHCEIGSAR